MLNLNKKEIDQIKKLNTPAKVQDFLNTLKFNFEEDGVDTIMSPLLVLRTQKAHCIEGAILGAYILSTHGYKPQVLHLKAAKGDFDHVIAIFKQDGLWGALSKTNHSVLRYREPIYKNIHELVMSYFHEYFLNSGEKTLRKYSRPLNLNVFENGWETSEDSLWGIDEELDNIKHFDIAPKSVFEKLRRADKIECEVGKIADFISPKKKQK